MRDVVYYTDLDVPAGADNLYPCYYPQLNDRGVRRSLKEWVFVIVADPHPEFERRGHDLVCNKTVSLAEVLKGDPIPITTIDGEIINVTLPRGALAGGPIPVRGRGFRYTDTLAGDLVINITVEWPETLTRDQIAAIRALLPTDANAYA